MDVQPTLDGLVARGALPGGLVGVVEGEDVLVALAGHADPERRVALAPEARFRWASVTKPVLAALAVALVDDGLLAFDAPVARWLPELAAPVVVRTPQSALDDVVPARGPVRLEHLLASTSGWGYGSDFTAPAIRALVEVTGDGRRRELVGPPQTWLDGLSRTPMLAHPGERFLYDTSYDLLGLLLARAAGRPLEQLLAERLLEPLGMHATGFSVAPAARADVVATVVADGGVLRPAAPGGRLDVPPAFCSGAGGLLGTLGDALRFARMLLGDGELEGRRVLTPAAVAALDTDRLGPSERAGAGHFLDGQSWGWGGTVDVVARRPWEVVGRYGWTGATGTSLHVVRAQRRAVVVMTARELVGPDDGGPLEALWTAAARRP